MLSPIREYAREFDTPTPRAVNSALIAWVLHAINTSICRKRLKEIVADEAGKIATILSNMRSDANVFAWKLQAVRHIHKMPSTIEKWHYSGKDLELAGKDYNLQLPDIHQQLSEDAAKTALKTALASVAPVINSLAHRKVAFVTKFYHGDPQALLTERALMTFWWSFPYMRNPGAHLNTAVCNYANNIARDASAKKRATTTGSVNEGTFQYLNQDLDMSSIASSIACPPDIEDIKFDLACLSEFDQSVVIALIEDDQDAIRQLQSSSDYQSALSRIRSYLITGDLGRAEGVAHSWA